MTDRFETEHELKRIIEDSLGAERIFSTRMRSHRDHAGDPALSIAVSMKAATDIPYLYFDALDIDRSPDDVDDFEPSPEDFSFTPPSRSGQMA